MLHHPEVKVEALLDAARARFTLPPTSPHGAGHWMRVLKYGRVFARELQGDEALVVVAAIELADVSDMFQSRSTSTSSHFLTRCLSNQSANVTASFPISGQP